MTTAEAHPIIMWELTRACDMHCRNCVSGATAIRNANELTTYEAYKTVDQIASLQPREFVITGGDPLERADLEQIVDYSRRRGLRPTLMVVPSSRLTTDAIRRLSDAGLTRMVFSIDGSTAIKHQSVRGISGSFNNTVSSIRAAEEAGMAIEINTLVTRRTAADLQEIAAFIRPMNPVRWNIHFVVPIGGSTHVEILTGTEIERVFGELYEISRRELFAVRVIEAPHYRRFLLQKNLESWLESGNVVDTDDTTARAADPLVWRTLLDATLDGPRTFAYISHAGDVRASEFMPQSAGNLCYRPLGAIYRASDLFVALRDSSNLKGRCGRCEYRHVCGGSRARAWAMTGDLFASDPLCAYEPGEVLDAHLANEADTGN